MRVILLFLILPLASLSQVDSTNHKGTIKITKKYIEADHWPRIEGKLHGEISRAHLCGGSGIKTVYPYSIMGFTLKSSYIKDTSGLKSSSHLLTDGMCEVITSLPNGSTIHIEDIIAQDEKGNQVRLNSLRFELVGKHD